MLKYSTNGRKAAFEIPVTPAATVVLIAIIATVFVFSKISLNPLPVFNPYQLNHKIMIPVTIIGLFPYSEDISYFFFFSTLSPNLIAPINPQNPPVIWITPDPEKSAKG